MTMYQYLSHLSGITVKQQKKTIDIVEAHDLVSEAANTYRVERSNVDTNFSLIYTQGVTMAEKVGTVAAMPRITARQQHRSNAETNSVEEYFRKNVAIPLLDHIVMCINQQFSPSAITAVSLLGLLSSILCSKDVCLETALRKYRADFPSPELMQMEFRGWENRYMAMSYDLRPSSPAKALYNIKEIATPTTYQTSSFF